MTKPLPEVPPETEQPPVGLGTVALWSTRMPLPALPRISLPWIRLSQALLSIRMPSPLLERIRFSVTVFRQAPLSSRTPWWSLPKMMTSFSHLLLLLLAPTISSTSMTRTE